MSPTATNLLHLPNRADVRTAKPDARTDAASRRRIEALRHFAQRHAVSPASNWDHACRVIAAERSASLEAYAFALLGALETYALRRVVFYERGSAALSDSEAWIASLFRALERSDAPSVRALLAFRLARIGHRRTAYLAAGLLSMLDSRDRAGNFVDSAKHSDPNCGCERRV